MADNDSPTDFVEQSFRSNLRSLREARGLTQGHLAAALKQDGLPFHQQTVQKIESGERPPRLAEAIAIARVLGVDLQDLLDPPAVHELAMRIDRVIDTEAAVARSMREHEKAQLALATYADMVQIAEESEDAEEVRLLVSKTPEDIAKEHRFVQARERQKKKQYEEFVDSQWMADDPELVKLIQQSRDNPGRFLQILEASRGEHPEEA